MSPSVILLNMVKWYDEPDTYLDLCQAHSCDVNRGVLDNSGKIKPPEANIYVEDILAAATFREYMLRLLAATIKAICGLPNIDVRQCPLLLEKWLELIVGPRQIVVSLLVDTNKMMIGLTN